MYARDHTGQEEPLTFGVSGMLIKNALVMYDHQTDTLWSQFLHVAVRGPLEGERLDIVPAQLTTWAAWRETHPDTLVLDQGGAARDPYDSYYVSPTAGVIGVDVRDERFDTKEFVLGIQQEGAPLRAYPYRWLNDEPVVNDRLGDLDIVVVFDRETAASAAFLRDVDDDTLTFEPAETLGGDRFVDRETGSVWSQVTGRAVDGPLEGTQLQRLDAIPTFWFAWVDFFPDADVWEPEGSDQ